jgi:hypothetical protein
MIALPWQAAGLGHSLPWLVAMRVPVPGGLSTIFRLPLLPAGKVSEQARIFRNLMQKTTPRQMKWLVQIILKNLRVR